MLIHRRLLQILSMVVMLATIFSGFVTPFASAQGTDGLKRQFNAQTGKVNFLSPESGRVLPASRALGITTFARPADPGMALVKRFGPEFGLQNPQRDLTELKTNRLSDGRLIVRYQQNYQGIPIISGELIVNTNDNGDLYSINGEISPDFSISTQPQINSEQARQTALHAVAKWYQKATEDFVTSEPQLWVYDESLLRPSNQPAELVWRIEVTTKDVGTPVRELVLVNAERGHISLHFNQIDTTWVENPESSNEQTTNMPLQAGVTWYVATTGSNSNSCTSGASPCKTINGALGKATAGDIIKVATGTYMGTGSQVVNISKGITLSGGWNASFTTQDGMSTIDGQTARRGITTTGPNVAIDHFVIHNGFHASQGGGVYNNGGALTLSNNRIINNVSQGMGGGIFNYGSLTVHNTSITDNRAGDLCCSSGGGGAGIENWNGTLTLNNSLVAKNTLLGIFQGSGIDNAGTVISNNSTVSGNTGGNGVGISSGGGTVVLNNTTIIENQSYGLLSSGNITLRNSIIARNGTNGDCNNGGTISSGGYNLIGDNTGCPFVAATGDMIGTKFSPIDPHLAPLQDNGGPTFTHALMTGSPAIDAGNPTTPGSGGNACLATDQRGVARPVGARCDIGAFEGSVAGAPTGLIRTYTASNSTSLPGTFICSQADPNCAAGDAHARAAHKYAIGTTNLYAAQHSRNSIDNNGMTVVSSVHYSTGYANASWNGNQMVYGDAYGFPLADDVVAHELTHGVTQYESNLFYYYQSGAINESLSDLWGEYYDQGNSQGTDTSAVRWQIGEDVSGAAVFRSMSNPTLFGDPDRMSSVNYYEGADDSGGVHTNSGVNNKAIYLMVDGGTFNGKTVTALGWEKTTAIYYEVNTNLLSSGTDYSDLYYALQQACSNLIGQKGITAANCLEVKDAIDAVEMNTQPAPNFNTDAPYCDSGNPTATIFSDGLESGAGNWTFNNGANTRWQVDSPYGPYASSGDHFLYADDYPPSATDASAQLVSVAIPSGAYLHFSHAYDFETSNQYYDGGVLEYSINGGSSWIDAGSLIDFNGYKGTIFTGEGNPLSGRSAFVDTSHGYIDTRLNLASLAGKTVTFRWRMGLDGVVSAWGWWVDDIRIYRCMPDPVGLGTYDDSHPAWSYSGVWETYSNSGPLNNSLHYTNVQNASASIIFTGTQFTVYYTQLSNRGNVEVWIDGVQRYTFNENGSTFAWQQSWTLPTPLSNGTHTVQFKNPNASTSTYIDIDAITIHEPDSVAPSAINTLTAVTGTTAGSVNLSWTAVGDDGNTGSAASYLVRYSTSPISSEATWNNATPFVNSLLPKAAGGSESLTVTGLVPGMTYYFAVRARDEQSNVGGLSNSPSAMAKQATPVGPGTYDDSHAAWSYQGGWETYANSGPMGNTLHYTNMQNASASITFTGMQFTVYFTQLANRGEVQVWIDGLQRYIFNEQGSTFAWQQSWTLPTPLSNGTHTVQFKNPSANPATYIDIDAIAIAEPVGPGTYDDSHAAWTYTGIWQTYANSGPMGDTLHYTNAQHASASITFTGSQFTLYYTQIANRGNVEVWIDGVQQYTFNEKNNTFAWQQSWTLPEPLTNGQHTVEFRNPSSNPATYIDIDAIAISEPVGPGSYDDAHPAWIYTGAWEVYANPGPLSNTLHYTNAQHASASLTFTGSQFTLHYTQLSNRGNVEVWIDGVQRYTFNENGSAFVWQQAWTLPEPLSNGIHIVQFKNPSADPATYIDIDTIEIIQ